jgi:hypothetical protein
MLPAVPHRAAAQTRRRLRAGHRAETVACRCRCRRRRARCLALQWCRTFVPMSAHRVPARCRHPHVCTAVVRHTPARTPERLNPSVLSCSFEVQRSAFSGQRLMANTHTAVARNAGAAGLSSPLWSFLLCRRAWPGTSPLGRMYAHTRSFAGVCPPTNTAGPFLAVFPFLCSLA